MATASKFNKDDRREVIEALEAHCDTTLSQVGRRPKWCRDSLGRNWCVLGGSGLWHGIPKEIVDAETRALHDGVLVIVKKGNTFEVFKGPLRAVAKHVDHLFENQRDHYHVDCDVIGGRMFVKGRQGFRVVTLNRAFTL